MRQSINLLSEVAASLAALLMLSPTVHPVHMEVLTDALGNRTSGICLTPQSFVVSGLPLLLIMKYL